MARNIATKQIVAQIELWNDGYDVVNKFLLDDSGKTLTTDLRLQMWSPLQHEQLTSYTVSQTIYGANFCTKWVPNVIFLTLVLNLMKLLHNIIFQKYMVWRSQWDLIVYYCPYFNDNMKEVQTMQRFTHIKTSIMTIMTKLKIIYINIEKCSINHNNTRQTDHC